jgi:hypothetical protein
MKVNIKSARRPNTLRKQVRISPEADQKFAEFAAANQISYSASLEMLGLIGLDTDLAHILIPVMRQLVPVVVQQIIAEQNQQLIDLLRWQNICTQRSQTMMRLITGRLLHNIEQHDPQRFDEIILHADRQPWSERVNNLLTYLEYEADGDALADLTHLQRRLATLQRRHRRNNTRQAVADE